MTTELSALDELKLLRLKSAHPEHSAVSIEVLRGVFSLAFRALADKDAEIQRLQAELDAREDNGTEYVMERHLEQAMAADPDRRDGTVLRCTDNPARSVAWRAAKGEWEQVQ